MVHTGHPTPIKKSKPKMKKYKVHLRDKRPITVHADYYSTPDNWLIFHKKKEHYTATGFPSERVITFNRDAVDYVIGETNQ